MKGLIAEIGNHHFGDLVKAKELIVAAKESGANYVKMQAIDPKTVVNFGSMPLEFYEKCALKIQEYRACINYGNAIGIAVFFSFFGSKFNKNRNTFGAYHKISAGQFEESTVDWLSRFNTSRTVISIGDQNNLNVSLKRKARAISNATIMYASSYDKPHKFETYDELSRFFKHKDIGYSDHQKGIDYCVKALERGSKLIEKHFYLGDKIEFDGVMYRDCEHSANPETFLELSKAFKGA